MAIGLPASKARRNPWVDTFPAQATTSPHSRTRHNSLGGRSFCHSNFLASLAGAPQSVGSDFLCEDNQLTSLAHAPKTVGGVFWCYNNNLTSLAHAPQKFKRLKSDFGKFKSWEKIPPNLRGSEAAKTPPARNPGEAVLKAESMPRPNRDIFNLPAGPFATAEQILQSLKIDYRKQPDGALVVPGDIDLSWQNLTRLPDLSGVIVEGFFKCDGNQLTSLKGAPQSVGRYFSCSRNKLTSLEYSPRTVGGGFYCCTNQLTSLKHSPQSVGKDFWCSENRLKSLEHAPQSVGEDFYCSDNPITSLEHAPRNVGGGFFCNRNLLTNLLGAPHTVGGSFSCTGNKLTSLRGAPQSVGFCFDCSNNPLQSLGHAPRKFERLISDFGGFTSWNDVPQNLQTTPTKHLRKFNL